MIASGLFLGIWVVFIGLGFAWCAFSYTGLSVAESFQVWLRHDIIYTLVISWLIAGFIVFFIYILKTSGVSKGTETKK